MTESRTQSLIFLFAPSFLAFFLFLWVLPHSDLSKREARETIPVVQMERGAPLWLPKINDERYRTKPPMFYWASLAIAKLRGGVDEISMRLPSVLAGTGTVFLTTLLGTWLFSPIAGCFAGLILAASWRFTYLASHARIDMLFAFFTTLAFVFFWRMLTDPEAGARNTASWIGSIALGLAVLTKGPLGWAFPVAAVFIFQKLYDAPPIPWRRLFLIPIGVTLLWILPAFLEGGKEFQDMIWRETVGRASGEAPIHIHREPFYFYIPQIFLGWAPWSLFLPGILWAGFKSDRYNPRWLYPALALVFLFVFISLFPGKRGDYLLPLYPMAAVLTGRFFSGLDVSEKFTPWVLKLPTRLIVTVLGVLALALIFLIFAPHFDPDTHLRFLSSRDRWMATLLVGRHLPSAVILLAAAAAMLWIVWGLVRSLQQGSKVAILILVMGWAFAVLLFVHGPGARAVNQYSSAKLIADKIKLLFPDKRIIFFGETREDILYYMGPPYKEENRKRAVRALKDNPGALLAIPDSLSRSLLKRNPELKVIYRPDPDSQHYSFKKYILLAYRPGKTADEE